MRLLPPPLRITFFDILLIIVTVGIAAASFSVTPSMTLSGGRHVEIYCANRLEARYPLDQDVTTKIVGPLGPTVVRIKNGRVSIAASPCPNKRCMHSGDFGAEGGALLCIPNQVIVRSAHSVPDGLDGMSR